MNKQRLYARIAKQLAEFRESNTDADYEKQARIIVIVDEERLTAIREWREQQRDRQSSRSDLGHDPAPCNLRALSLPSERFSANNTPLPGSGGVQLRRGCRRHRCRLAAQLAAPRRAIGA